MLSSAVILPLSGRSSSFRSAGTRTQFDRRQSRHILGRELLLSYSWRLLNRGLLVIVRPETGSPAEKLGGIVLLYRSTLGRDISAVPTCGTLVSVRAPRISADPRRSVCRKGDCWDNAPMESFFHTLKTELVMHCDYKTRAEARASIFDYVEVFYNRQRRHSSVRYEARITFEYQQSPHWCVHRT